MLARALAILFAVVSASVALTMYFGQDVLVALGLILVQLKVVGKKLASVELPAILTWLRAETSAFFQIELLKKWAMTTLLPLLLGNALLKKFSSFIAKYRDRLAQNYEALINWYAGLDWPVKVVTALIVLFALLGLSVSSLGLWLILFSVKLPFWLLAAASSFMQMIWLSVRKMAFKTVAFLQLGWLWRLIRNRLPQSYLDRKRKLDFRVARAVVRRRRMTVRQLADSKDSMAMRWAVVRARWFGRRSRDESES